MERRITTSTILLAVITAQAQPHCTGLSVGSLGHAAFDPNALELRIENAGPDFFPYPQFTLLNEDMAVVAEETLNFFGIGTGPQWHLLQLQAGATIPDAPFTGTLMLNYAPDSVCQLPVNVGPLCPQVSCTDLHVYIAHNVTLDDAYLSWWITDEGGNTVAYDDVLLTSEEATHTDTTCLAPGSYALHVMESPFSPGTGVNYISMFHDVGATWSPTTIMPGGGVVEVPFEFYTPCADVANGIEESPVPEFLWNVHNDMLTVTDPGGNALGSLLILDARGAIIHSSATNSDRRTVDLSGRARGLYVIVREGRAHRHAQRFVLP